MKMTLTERSRQQRRHKKIKQCHQLVLISLVSCRSDGKYYIDYSKTQGTGNVPCIWHIVNISAFSPSIHWEKSLLNRQTWRGWNSMIRNGRPCLWLHFDMSKATHVKTEPHTVSCSHNHRLRSNHSVNDVRLAFHTLTTWFWRNTYCEGIPGLGQGDPNHTEKAFGVKVLLRSLTHKMLDIRFEFKSFHLSYAH